MSTDKKTRFILVRDLLVEFYQKNKKVKAVKWASFDIYKGEIFSIVGESGSGKTTIGRALAGVQNIKDGSVYMDDRLIRGKVLNLYKLSQTINSKINFVKSNNILISKMINAYLNNLKISYYKFFENKHYNVLTRELKPYHKRDFSFKTAEDFKKINILNFQKNNINLKKIKEFYEINLSFLKTVLKRYQRVVRFIDGLNEYVSSLSLDLEKEIINRVQENNAIIQQNILLANNIYKNLLKLDEIGFNYQKEISKKSLENYYHDTFLQLKNLIPLHQKFLKKVNEISQNQQVIFLLFLPENKRKKYILAYNKKVNVSQKDFKKVYQQKLKTLEKTNDNQEKITALNLAFNNSWRKIKLAKNINQILILWNKTHNPKAILASLSDEKQKDLKDYLKSYQSDILVFESMLKDLNYLYKYKFFRDKQTIKLYYQWLKIEKKIGDNTINNSNRFLDFLELPLIDEIVKKSSVFKKLSKKEIREQKQKIQMIFQDPASSLNDRISVEEIISEGLNNFPELYNNDEVKKMYLKYVNDNLDKKTKKMSLSQVKSQDVKKFLILNIIKEVGLLPEHLSRYSHEFSGGQRQRIGIARALIMNPKFIIADEPISALDVSIRAQILNLLKKFQERINLTYIFVAHDLSVVKFIADRIAVIYHGQIVELAPAQELFSNPLHPYTRALLSAIPIPNPNYEKRKVHFIYNPEQEHHDYNYDLPEFIEILPNHFIFANNREIIAAKKNILNYKKEG